MFKINSSNSFIIFIDREAVCADGQIGNAGKCGGKLDLKNNEYCHYSLFYVVSIALKKE